MSDTVSERHSADPLTTENDTEWYAVAHWRGYTHLSTACRTCRLELKVFRLEQEAGR